MRELKAPLFLQCPPDPRGCRGSWLQPYSPFLALLSFQQTSPTRVQFPPVIFRPSPPLLRKGRRFSIYPLPRSFISFGRAVTPFLPLFLHTFPSEFPCFGFSLPGLFFSLKTFPGLSFPPPPSKAQWVRSFTTPHLLRSF